jgi:hypothetical protein
MLAAAHVERADAIEHTPRAVDGIHSDPGRAAVGGAAVHSHDDVDAALIRERHPAGGADHDDRKLRKEAERLADAKRRVVPSGLARGADRKHEPAAHGAAVGDGLHCRERRRQRAFLFGHAAAAHECAARLLDQFAGIGIAHAVGRMGHGIGHQHKAPIRALGPELDQEIAHAIAPAGQAEAADQRHHLIGDEALHLRLLLEGVGLRAWLPDKGTRPFDDVRGRNAQMSIGFHPVPP